MRPQPPHSIIPHAFTRVLILHATILSVMPHRSGCRSEAVGVEGDGWVAQGWVGGGLGVGKDCAHARSHDAHPHLRDHTRAQTINFIMNVSGGWCAREELGTGVSAASSSGCFMLLNNTPHTSNIIYHTSRLKPHRYRCVELHTTHRDKRASPVATLVRASHHYGCPWWSVQQTERACAARVS